MTPEDKLKKLQDMLKLIDENITRDEFVKAFEEVLKLVKEAEFKLGSKLDSAFSVAVQKLSNEFAAHKSDSAHTLASLRKDIQNFSDQLFKEQKNSLNFLNDKVRSLKNGKDGKDGKNGRDGRDGKDGKDGAPGKDGKDGKGGGGSRGITLYVNGAKKLLTAQTINITGSGVTYNYANGRNDITITGGAGAFSILAATGAINNSNTAFTFASAPTVVVVNGAMYRDGSGCTISGTSVTLDNPVGSGGDIYGLG